MRAPVDAVENRDADVHGGPVERGDIEALRAVLAHRGLVGLVAERRDGIAVRRRRVHAAARRAGLRTPKLRRRHSGERRVVDEEEVRDATRHRSFLEHDEAVVLAGRRSGGRMRDDRHHRLAAGRNGHDAGQVERRAGRRRLRASRDRPRARATARIGEPDEQAARGLAAQDVQILERERGRAREDLRVGCARQRDEAAALERDRRLAACVRCPPRQAPAVETSADLTCPTSTRDGAGAGARPSRRRAEPPSTSRRRRRSATRRRAEASRRGSGRRVPRCLGTGRGRMRSAPRTRSS